MLELTPDEARVLGVLIEKATTTPDQYPLTQNAVMNGANQKSNRDPLLSLDDHQTFDALERLRAKGLVVRVHQAGSRVDKFRHTGGETLHARSAELAILAELMLRGPQTLGELRGRASRMAAMESLDAVKNMLGALMERDEPLVRQLPPATGSRAERYVQLLSPESHGIDAPITTETGADSTSTATGQATLASRVAALEAEVQTLRQAITRLSIPLGETDIFARAPGDPESREV